MKKFIIYFVFIFASLTTQAAMYVCYGNDNNCYGSNGNCEDLAQECSTEPGDYSIGGCNCTQLWGIITSVDEYNNPRYFQNINGILHILNAETSNWVGLYDLEVIDEARAYQIRYVSSLSRVVIELYMIDGLEYEYAQSNPDISTAWDGCINIHYAD